MESRLKRYVLAVSLVFAWSGAAAQESDPDGDVLGQIVSPDLERREIKEDKIDSENIEVGIFAGVLSVEDFGSNDAYGARLGLHITEDIFIEVTGAVSELQETSYELLSGDTQLLTDDERELTYYNLGLGWNIFPGEVYLGKWAFKHNFYLIGGAGNTLFADNEYFTYHFGGGLRLFTTDWLALRMDVRNHVMTHSIFGEDKEIQNLEAQVGLTVFF